jgi:hypothetical protein
MDWYELVQTYAHSRQLSTARLNKIIFLFQQGVTRGGRADSKFREELLRCMIYEWARAVADTPSPAQRARARSELREPEALRLILGIF